MQDAGIDRARTLSSPLSGVRVLCTQTLSASMQSNSRTGAANGTVVVFVAGAIVFISSAFIMTLELVAARLVAQHLGVSL